MCTVCKFQPGGNRADGFVRLRQALCDFFQAEGHAVVVETLIGVFISDTIQVITAVMEKLLQLRAGHASVALLEETRDACEKKEITVGIQMYVSTVIVLRRGQMGQKGTQQSAYLVKSAKFG